MTLWLSGMNWRDWKNEPLHFMSSARSGGLCSTNGQGQFEFRLYYDVEDRVGYGDWSPQCATLRNICNTLSIWIRKGPRSHVAQPCQKCGSVFFVSILAAQLKKFGVVLVVSIEVFTCEPCSVQRGLSTRFFQRVACRKGHVMMWRHGWPQLVSQRLVYCWNCWNWRCIKHWIEDSRPIIPMNY